MSDYLVDVLMPTYNHELYIEEALSSIVSQRVKFKFRILIAEDFSTDNTREIIEQFKLKYPYIIFPYYREKNLGAFENSRLLFKEVNSKYSALCEGDDYWTDGNKLQEQIDILEERGELVGCFHNTEERFQDEDKASFLYCNYPSSQKITFRDLSYANVIPSCSMVYRSKLFKFPSWFHDLKMGDWPLHLLNAQFGDYWYIPKMMAVHRLHNRSLWMLQDAERNRQYISEAYDTMLKHFEKNEERVGYLLDAQRCFNDGMKLEKNNPNYKERVKDALIRVIRKF